MDCKAGHTRAHHHEVNSRAKQIALGAPASSRLVGEAHAWTLRGSRGTSAAIGVGRLACIDAGESPASPPLPSLPKEWELLAQLAQASPGVVDDSIADATLGELTGLLEGGGVGLLHFASTRTRTRSGGGSMSYRPRSSP